MMKFMKSFSVAMVLASASIAMTAQANVVSVDEKDVAVLEAAWVNAQKTSVADNLLAYKNVAVLADKLMKNEPQDVVERASKVQSEAQAALRSGYVGMLAKSLNQEVGDYFTVVQNRNGIVLRVESNLMDEAVVSYLSDRLFVQDDAFTKDFRKIEFVNAKTGFVEVVQNYKIPRVAS